MHGMRDRDSYDAVTTVLAVLADAAAIWIGQMLAVWIRFDSGWIPLRYTRVAGLYQSYAVAAALTVVIYLAVFQILKLYTRPQDGTFIGKVPRLVRACLFGGGGVLVCSGLLKNDMDYSFVSNAAILVSLATVTLLVLAERELMFHLEIAIARRVAPCHRALILGANDDALLFLRAIERDPRMRTRIVAIVPVGGEKRCAELPEELVKGDSANLEAVVRDDSVDMLILASHILSHTETVALVVFCEQHLVRFSMIPDLFRMMTSKMDFQMIGSVPIVGVGRWPLDQVWNRMLKRIVDLVGGFVGMVLSIPFILVSAIVIKCESKGPVFYAQERCGRRGKTFRIYKLRTMRTDAEKGDHPGWTVDDDPRRTRSGAFLRKWNIDELPQFFNILRGQMSLVGTRPPTVDEWEKYEFHHRARLACKPGISGLWQVSGRSEITDFEEVVRLDTEYITNWSFALDLKILIKTIGVVFGGKGAM